MPESEAREAILRDGCGLADLWELSRPRIEDSEQHTEAIVDKLFPGNPLLCCGASSPDFDTRPRDDWRGELSELALIVPSPMSAVTGLTKDGKESKHTLANTGPRRFVICEFDTGTVDDHAAILIHLAGFAPLVCAVHSGGKVFTAGFTSMASRKPRWKSFSATPFPLARTGRHGRAHNSFGCQTAPATTAPARRCSFSISNPWSKSDECFTRNSGNSGRAGRG